MRQRISNAKIIDLTLQKYLFRKQNIFHEYFFSILELNIFCDLRCKPRQKSETSEKKKVNQHFRVERNFFYTVDVIRKQEI